MTYLFTGSFSCHFCSWFLWRSTSGWHFFWWGCFCRVRWPFCTYECCYFLLNYCWSTGGSVFTLIASSFTRTRQRSNWCGTRRSPLLNTIFGWLCDFPPLFLLDVLRFELVLFVHQAAARLMNKWECQDVLRLRKKKDLDQLRRPKS